MAELITLSGDYSLRYNRRQRVNSRNDELMGGLLDFFKSAGKTIVSPVVSVAKGVGHTTMEIGRGIKSGDIKRILTAPAKGIGHTFMTQGRTYKEFSEFFWRPSKMKDWMKPIGGAVMAIGAVPGPHSIFMVPIGAALVLGGSIGESVYIKDQMKKAASATQKQTMEEQKKANYLWYGVGALGVVGAYMALT